MCMDVKNFDGHRAPVGGTGCCVHGSKLATPQHVAQPVPMRRCQLRLSSRGALSVVQSCAQPQRTEVERQRGCTHAPSPQLTQGGPNAKAD